MKELPTTEYGDRTLKAWAVAENATWVQTRVPKLSKRLSKLDGAKRVATGVKGGYLTTWELPYTLDWVNREVITPWLSEKPQIS